MSWFGFGGSNEKKGNESNNNSVNTMNIDESAFDNHNSSDFSSPVLGGGGGSSSFEQELVLEQQKALVQAVVFKLTDISFDNCVTKPSTSLSSSEQSCISSVVGKYLDTSELIVGRFSSAANQQH